MRLDSDLIIRRFVGGPLLTVSYALIAPGHETVIIDAPRDAWRGGLEAASALQAPVSLAIATHGHWDHITDLSELQAMQIPVAGHLADEYLFADPMGYRSELPYTIEPVNIDIALEEGQHLTIGDQEVRILHTPGHTHGSVCLWIQDHDVLITGDTVLKGGAGYLERAECDPQALATSVQRIARFPDTTALLPGHGGPTTIEEEPWLSNLTTEELINSWLSGANRWTPR